MPRHKKLEKTHSNYNMKGLGSVLSVITGGANELEDEYAELKKRENFLEKRILETELKLANKTMTQDERKLLANNLENFKKKRKEYQNKREETIKKMKGLTTGLIKITENVKTDLQSKNKK